MAATEPNQGMIARLRTLTFDSQKALKPGHLHFHPRYQHPLARYNDNVIIQTEDGIRFHYSLEQLARISGFFEGIRDLSHDVTVPFELPRANGHEFSTILDVMCPPKYLPITADVSLNMVQNVEGTRRGAADAYDFHTFADTLVLLIRDGEFVDKFAQLALALIVDQPQLTKDISSATLVSSIGNIDPEIRRVLSTQWPSLWLRLQHLHRRHENHLKIFDHELAHAWPMYNGVEGFGKMCQGTATKSRGICQSHRSVNGKFSSLRNKAAQAVMEQVRIGRIDTDGLTAEAEIELVLRDVVQCRSCRTRLGRTFALARSRSPNTPDFHQCI